MILADTLSRAYVNANSESGDLEEDLICAINLIVNNLPASNPKLQEIHNTTEHDSTMMKLNTIQSGWPRQRSQVSQEFRDY